MSWNDNGQLGTWGSEDELYNAPWLRVAEDLIEAYNERASRLNYSPNGGPIPLIDEPQMFEPNLSPIFGTFDLQALALVDQYTYTQLIETSWDRLETIWVDYTVNDGNFEGLGSIPLMTKDRILEILGQDEFLRLTSPTGEEFAFSSVQNYHPVFVAWADQTYKVLNLLRWSHEVYTYFDDRLIDMDSTYRRASSSISWADAVSKFENTPTISTEEFDSSLHFSAYDGANWRVERKYDTEGTITGLPDDIAHTIQSYSYISTGPSVSYDVFENNDFASENGTLTPTHTDDMPQVTDRHTIKIGDLDGTKVTVSEPALNESRGYYYSIGNGDWFAITANFHILKWDVEGGYNLIDDAA